MYWPKYIKAHTHLCRLLILEWNTSLHGGHIKPRPNMSLQDHAALLTDVLIPHTFKLAKTKLASLLDFKTHQVVLFETKYCLPKNMQSGFRKKCWINLIHTMFSQNIFVNFSRIFDIFKSWLLLQLVFLEADWQQEAIFLYPENVSESKSIVRVF